MPVVVATVEAAVIWAALEARNVACAMSVVRSMPGDGNVAGAFLVEPVPGSSLVVTASLVLEESVVVIGLFIGSESFAARKWLAMRGLRVVLEPPAGKESPAWEAPVVLAEPLAVAAWHGLVDAIVGEEPFVARKPLVRGVPLVVAGVVTGLGQDVLAAPKSVVVPAVLEGLVVVVVLAVVVGPVVAAGAGLETKLMTSVINEVSVDPPVASCVEPSVGFSGLFSSGVEVVAGVVAGKPWRLVEARTVAWTIIAERSELGARTAAFPFGEATTWGVVADVDVVGIVCRAREENGKEIVAITVPLARGVVAACVDSPAGAVSPVCVGSLVATAVAAGDVVGAVLAAGALSAAGCG